ncbi:hypothetical protein B0H17DRAFT_1259746 [Mycena rosella]|uniref:Uncharacterized protein n=1 Tax=Mycena rosella TaxID=1033263 RepID=A0AAD7CS20_MYCRO|nr:hypothetical protein B0H17DRAFT_1259746 [Mycena rosella]
MSTKSVSPDPEKQAQEYGIDALGVHDDKIGRIGVNKPVFGYTTVVHPSGVYARQRQMHWRRARRTWATEPVTRRLGKPLRLHPPIPCTVPSCLHRGGRVSAPQASLAGAGERILIDAGTQIVTLLSCIVFWVSFVSGFLVSSLMGIRGTGRGHACGALVQGCRGVRVQRATPIRIRVDGDGVRRGSGVSACWRAQMGDNTGRGETIIRYAVGAYLLAEHRM